MLVSTESQAGDEREPIGATHHRLHLGASLQVGALELESFDRVDDPGDNQADFSHFRRAPFGMELGHGFARQGVVKLWTQFDHQKREQPGWGGRSLQTYYAFLPSVEATLRPESRVRPFVGPIAGVEGGYARDSDAKLRHTSFVYGGVVGLHAFPTRGVSVSPWVQVRGFRGNTRVTPLGSESVRLSRNGMGLFLGVSLAGWVPTRQQARSASPPSTLVDPGEPHTEVSSVAVGLSDGSQVHVVGRPSHSGESLVFRVSGPAANTDCSAPVIESQRGSIPLRVVEFPSRDVGGRQLQLLTTVEAVRALAEANAVLDICGTRLKLRRPDRARLRGFVIDFVDDAKVAGTWQETRPPPTEALHADSDEPDEVAPDEARPPSHEATDEPPSHADDEPSSEPMTDSEPNAGDTYPTEPSTAVP